MSKKDEPVRPEARLPKGLFDTPANELRATADMLATIRGVFERYGFEPLDTPAIEYTDALGKFLPDQDRPNEGVFSFKDDDEQWLSLRYDLTAPLARYVAENYQSLPKPFRRYQVGPVWRNEKPGPGRFRQFTQFDADTVGASSVAADAELCMLAADTLEALGVPRGQYVVKVNNRKVLDGVLDDRPGRRQRRKRLTVLRAIDKLDRLGIEVCEHCSGKVARTKAATSRRARTELPNCGHCNLRSINFSRCSGTSAAQMCSASDADSLSDEHARRGSMRSETVLTMRIGGIGEHRNLVWRRGTAMRPHHALTPPSCAGSNITLAPCSKPS